MNKYSKMVDSLVSKQFDKIANRELDKILIKKPLTNEDKGIISKHQPNNRKALDDVVETMIAERPDPKHIIRMLDNYKINKCELLEALAEDDLFTTIYVYRSMLLPEIDELVALLKKLDGDKPEKLVKSLVLDKEFEKEVNRLFSGKHHSIDKFINMMLKKKYTEQQIYGRLHSTGIDVYTLMKTLADKGHYDAINYYRKLFLAGGDRAIPRIVSVLDQISNARGQKVIEALDVSDSMESEIQDYMKYTVR